MIQVADNSVLSVPKWNEMPAPLKPSLEAIEGLERELLQWPQAECPLRHFFAPGVYSREVTMPAGTFIIGHCHKTEHLNIVLSGRATVMVEGVIKEINVQPGDAPYVFTSNVNVRKLLYIREETRWMTIHPTSETCLNRLEDELIIKSPTFLEYEKDIKQLKDYVKGEIE